jgi:peptidyl-tRNA hydrolase
MILNKWVDYDMTPHYQRDDNDAYSLPIVVRVERNETYSENDAFIAVALGMKELFSNNKWEESLQAWMRGRIRKVVRKARGAAWEKLFDFDHIYVKHNNVEVLIFEPHRLDVPLPAEIKKLQVQGIDFIPDTPVVSSGIRLAISVNPELTMSTGKTLAQIGHAAQIAILRTEPNVWEKWINNGSIISIEPWNTFDDNDVFDVFDAGFTEIPAGSLTVKSKWFL